MNASIFQQFREIADRSAGIHLREGKEAMVQARVAKRMRALGLQSPEAYLEVLRADDSGAELTEFLDAISTNFTSFYRERDHFDVLRAWAAEGPVPPGEEVRIWCAAAATGEEPYSIAFTLLDALPGGVRFRVLATDISTRALARASEGTYTEAAVAPVPAEQRETYLQPAPGASAAGGCHAVVPEVKRHIVFRRLNLATPPFPMRGPFHAVFCRNVMIYFERPTRQRLVAEAERLLAPDGMLFVGHAETLAGLDTRFRPVRPALYRAPGAAAMIGDGAT